MIFHVLVFICIQIYFCFYTPITLQLKSSLLSDATSISCNGLIESHSVTRSMNQQFWELAGTCRNLVTPRQYLESFMLVSISMEDIRRTACCCCANHQPPAPPHDHITVLPVGTPKRCEALPVYHQRQPRGYIIIVDDGS